MSKLNVPALSLCFLICSVSGLAADETTRSVRVTGTAVAKVKPDTVVWTVNITNQDPDLKAARDANDASTRKVLAMAAELKVADKDVQTGNLSIRKVFTRDRSGNQGAFRHYAFNRTIVVRQRDTRKFDDVLQAFTEVQNVELTYRLESASFHKLRRETRLRAVRVAKEKAGEMTKLLDAKLGHVLSIDETNRGQSPWQSSVSNAAFYSGPEVQPDEVEGTFAPGAIEIRVSVEVEFAIE